MLAPEVQWLKKLLAEEQWSKVLDVAGQILVIGRFTPVEYAEINYAVCRARAFRQELLQSIPPGELARRLCQDTQQWDLLGNVLLTLGVAYFRTRSHKAALLTFSSYFDHMDKYTTAHKLSGRVWHNIGNALVNGGQITEATAAFRRAREMYKRNQDDPAYYDQATLVLIDCYLETDIAAVPPLLSELRRNARGESAIPGSLSKYLLARARYAYCRGAFRWAASLCSTGLAAPVKYEWAEFKLNLTLSQCMSAIGEFKDALGYALAARMTAIRSQAFDLEFTAIEAMYDLISVHGTSLVRTLGNEYHEQGMDLVPLLGDYVCWDR